MKLKSSSVVSHRSAQLKRATILFSATAVLTAAMLCMPASAAVGGKIRKVAAGSMQIYLDKDMTVPVKELTFGDLVEIVDNGDGSYSVYQDGVALGYGSPVDLVEENAQVYVLAPYLYTVDSLGRSLVFDLCDIEYYLSVSETPLFKEDREKIILVQKNLLSALEGAVNALSDKGYTVWIEDGYQPLSASEYIGSAPSNTGCVVRLSIRRGAQDIGANPDSSAFRSAAQTLAKYGLLYVSGSDGEFYMENYGSYMGKDFVLSELPRTTADS